MTAAAGFVEEMTAPDIVSAANPATIEFRIELRIFHLRDRLRLAWSLNERHLASRRWLNNNTCRLSPLRADLDQTSVIC
jgi:hypothetical protein